MFKYISILLVVTLTTTRVSSKSVFGTIKENITWFHTNLSVVPAMTATLKYHIEYPFVLNRPRPIITFYYNGQDSPNFDSQCETDLYGQLRNEDLAVPLNKLYREKFFCYKENNHWICSGKTKIQDFEPKSYTFSLAVNCKRVSSANLYGLFYNVTIYAESNKTSCVDIGLKKGQGIDRCKRHYKYAAIPNQIGNTDLETAMFDLTQGLTLMDRLIDLMTHKSCLEEVYQLSCLAVLPECLPEKNKIVLPCREYCKGLLKDCLHIGLIAQLVGKFILNCDYLPSKGSNLTCYSNYDVCGPPPEVKHGYIRGKSVPFAKLGQVVRYSCNNSRSLRGNPNATCLASGEWTKPPKCVSHLSMVMIICIGVGGFTLLVLTITVITYCIVTKRRDSRRMRGPLQVDPTGNNSIINRSTEPLVSAVQYE